MAKSAERPPSPSTIHLDRLGNIISPRGVERLVQSERLGRTRGAKPPRSTTSRGEAGSKTKRLTASEYQKLKANLSQDKAKNMAKIARWEGGAKRKENSIRRERRLIGEYRELEK